MFNTLGILVLTGGDYRANSGQLLRQGDGGKMVFER